MLSEGACTLVLERADRARARGAHIFAEVASTGSAAEGQNPLMLEAEGKTLARAIETAISTRGSTATISAAYRPTGVADMYDRCETNAYKRVFGEQAYRIPVSAVKSMIGQSYSTGGLMGVGRRS